MGKSDKHSNADPKREEYLRKNKEAAARCRRKRMDEISKLQKKVKQLEDANDQKQLNIDHLVQQNKKLVDILQKNLGHESPELDALRPNNHQNHSASHQVHQPQPNQYPPQAYAVGGQQRYYQTPIGYVQPIQHQQVHPQAPAPYFVHPGQIGQSQVVRQQTAMFTTTINNTSDTWSQQVRRQMNRVKKTKGKTAETYQQETAKDPETPATAEKEKRTSSTSSERPDTLLVDESDSCDSFNITGEPSNVNQQRLVNSSFMAYTITPGLVTPNPFDVNRYRQRTFLTPIYNSEIPLNPLGDFQMTISPVYGMQFESL